MIEVIRAYPLLFVLLVVGPFVGGMVGTYLGYDNLSARLQNERQSDRIERRADGISNEISSLKPPLDTLRRY